MNDEARDVIKAMNDILHEADTIEHLYMQLYTELAATGRL